MTPLNHIIENIPTTVLMGFLGVGKTSAILNLLEQKPEHEKWAVLVNEFGKVGIDGAIYASQGVQVKEVAGGCMCCAAGVPLQVAVNNLLKEFRPDRLLIETTGLGHPKRVLDTLRGEYFNKSLLLKASICLVDPKNLKDTRYTRHETFIDQIALSDILVANKTDLADVESLHLFDRIVEEFNPKKLLAAKTEFGKLDLNWLDLNPEIRQAEYPNHHVYRDKNKQEITDSFQSVGWVYPENIQFDYDCIEKWITQFEPKGLKIERLKAILNTNKGCFIFNMSQSRLTVKELAGNAKPPESRLEIIAVEINKPQLEKSIEACKQRVK